LKKFNFILILSVVVSIISILAIFIGYKYFANKSQNEFYFNFGDAIVSISGFNQDFIKNGKNEWNLKAASAQYLNQKNQEDQVILNNISVTFILENNQKAYLTAQKGILKTDSNNLSVLENIIINRMIASTYHADYISTFLLYR